MDLKMLSKGNVLVFGDVILDKYISGNVDRVSPEAPVPVLKPSKEEIIELLSQYKGVTVVDNPANLEYPTPREFANDTEDVYVGRIRVQEIKDETWVSMWIVADNVYGKGAALNAVQILEALVKLNKV